MTTFTNTANPTVVMTTTLADMTSTLSFNAAAGLNRTVVQCRGSTENATPMNSSNLNVVGMSILFDVVEQPKFWDLEIISIGFHTYIGSIMN